VNLIFEIHDPKNSKDPYPAHSIGIHPRSIQVPVRGSRFDAVYDATDFLKRMDDGRELRTLISVINKGKHPYLVCLKQYIHLLNSLLGNEVAPDTLALIQSLI
jgi:hypothetical protein